MSLAVVTVVHGRHDHLALQERSLALGTRVPDVRVVVAVDDEQVTGPDVVRMPLAAGGRLPTAAARNLGVRTAREHGADRLVLLDVDCLVGPGTLAAYDAALTGPGGTRTVWSGPVTYLAAEDRPYPLDRLDGLGRPHPARPAPPPGVVERGGDWRLFWSLSFATTARAWDRADGFDERYTGYGAEDTDFGQRARAAGLDLAWVGAAPAYHQHHPTASPPVQHVGDVVRNGRIFAERWGWWPMQGWLEGFADLGLVEQRDDGWHVVGAA